jgi:hypothetical protein
MAQDMGLFTFPEVAHSSTEAMSPEMERARAITAWGVFSLNLCVKNPTERKRKATKFVCP